MLNYLGRIYVFVAGEKSKKSPGHISGYTKEEANTPSRMAYVPRELVEAGQKLCVERNREGLERVL